MTEQDAVGLKTKHILAYAEHRQNQNNNNDSINCEYLKQHLESILSICSDALEQVQNGNMSKAVRLYSHVSRHAIIPARNSHSANSTTLRPIHIYTLGRFSLLINSKNDLHTHRSSHRPLALLKCLIALGGRQIDQEKLIEALWPDIDGDAGSKAFHTTLYRLRKLLQHDEAIILKDGLLTLNSHYVWVDAWALERTLSHLGKACGQDQAPDEVEKLTSQVTDLYIGAFLRQDKEPLWALAYRERLQLRIQRVAMLLGQYWQAQSQTDKAVAAYERLLELDRLHEPAYQKLMQVFLAQGRHAEAAATYERCRKVLATALGVMPSTQTLALFQTIPQT